MGPRGTWAMGGEACQTPFHKTQEDEGRDRKKKERKKAVQIPTRERQTLKFVERRML